MTLELFKTIVDISTGLTAIALVMSLYKFPLRSPEVKVQSVGFFLSILNMAITEIAAPRGTDINISMNISIHYIILTALFMYHVAWKYRYRMVTIVGVIVYCIFGLWNYFYGQQESFNSNTLALGGLLIVIHSVLFFYYLLVNLPVQKLQRLPMFWFNTAYLAYFASSLFIFGAYVVEVFRDSLLLYWTIKNFLTIGHYILIIVGLCQDLRNIRLPSSSPSAP
jgi:hypothetical protein